MRHNAPLLIAVFLVVFAYLDYVLFAQYNLFDIRPNMLITLVVVIGIMLGSVRAGVVGVSVGMLRDLLMMRMLGVNAAIYMVTGVVAGRFFRKFYSDNVIVPAVISSVMVFVRENVFAIIALFGSAGYNYGRTLLVYILPCSILTGLVSIPLFLFLRPRLEQYGKLIAEKSEVRFDDGGRL